MYAFLRNHIEPRTNQQTRVITRKENADSQKQNKSNWNRLQIAAHYTDKDYIFQTQLIKHTQTLPLSHILALIRRERRQRCLFFIYVQKTWGG